MDLSSDRHELPLPDFPRWHFQAKIDYFRNVFFAADGCSHCEVVLALTPPFIPIRDCLLSFWCMLRAQAVRLAPLLATPKRLLNRGDAAFEIRAFDAPSNTAWAVIGASRSFQVEPGPSPHGARSHQRLFAH